MLQPKKSSERRQHDRFKHIDDLYVLLRSQANEEFAFLLDVSREGASFEYIYTSDTFEKAGPLDLIFEGKNSCTEKISCKTIFDNELDGEYFTPVKIRRIGVQFERQPLKSPTWRSHPDYLKFNSDPNKNKFSLRNAG
jgi:hypothetical protein